MAPILSPFAVLFEDPGSVLKGGVKVFKRLRQTGHREGTPVKGNRRLFISEGDADLPRVRVAYSILGDTLYVDVVYVPPPR